MIHQKKALDVGVRTVEQLTLFLDHFSFDDNFFHYFIIHCVQFIMNSNFILISKLWSEMNLTHLWLL